VQLLRPTHHERAECAGEGISHLPCRPTPVLATMMQQKTLKMLTRWCHDLSDDIAQPDQVAHGYMIGVGHYHPPNTLPSPSGPKGRMLTQDVRRGWNWTRNRLRANLQPGLVRSPAYRRLRPLPSRQAALFRLDIIMCRGGSSRCLPNRLLLRHDLINPWSPPPHTEPATCKPVVLLTDDLPRRWIPPVSASHGPTSAAAKAVDIASVRREFPSAYRAIFSCTVQLYSNRSCPREKGCACSRSRCRL
jgi:hypothetical protein